jgi:hypothetical protein
VDSYNDLRAAFERAKKIFFSDTDSFVQLPDFGQKRIQKI